MSDEPTGIKAWADLLRVAATGETVYVDGEPCTVTLPTEPPPGRRVMDDDQDD